MRLVVSDMHIFGPHISDEFSLSPVVEMPHRQSMQLLWSNKGLPSALTGINGHIGDVLYGLGNDKLHGGGTDMERRKDDRRSFETAPPFPFWTPAGWVLEDRRKRPDRRLSNIEVEFLAPIDTSKKNS